MKKTIYFKGIKFFDYNFIDIYNILKKGGYLVAPAASSLSSIFINNMYYKSLRKSNIAIFDSGFLCILLLIFKKKKVNKFSGYLFLKKLLESKLIMGKNILLINPNKKSNQINQKYMACNGYKTFSYIAPIYRKNFKDQKLFEFIKKKKINFIIINIGGEKQEILGYEINKKFNNLIPIICTGAAIGFLTGEQAPINKYIDRFYLGWAFRLIFNPNLHFSRFLKSWKLIKLFF